MELVEPASGLELWLLIVIIAAGVVCIVLVVVLVCYCIRRRNSKDKDVVKVEQAPVPENTDLKKNDQLELDFYSPNVATEGNKAD